MALLTPDQLDRFQELYQRLQRQQTREPAIDWLGMSPKFRAVHQAQLSKLAYTLRGYTLRGTHPYGYYRISLAKPYMELRVASPTTAGILTQVTLAVYEKPPCAFTVGPAGVCDVSSIHAWELEYLGYELEDFHPPTLVSPVFDPSWDWKREYVEPPPVFDPEWAELLNDPELRQVFKTGAGDG